MAGSVFICNELKVGEGDNAAREVKEPSASLSSSDTAVLGEVSSKMDRAADCISEAVSTDDDGSIDP
jgi:hypothetical protein